MPSEAPEKIRDAITGFRRAAAGDPQVVVSFIGGSDATATWDERSDLDLYLIVVAPFAKGWASVEMAECFLNSGNPTLAQTAQEWAASHGYLITELPGGGSPQWGSG